MPGRNQLVIKRWSVFSMPFWALLLVAQLCTAPLTSAAPRLVANTNAADTAAPPFHIADEFIAVLTRDARTKVQVGPVANGRPSINLSTLQTRINEGKVVALERQFATAKPYPVGHKFPDLTGHYIVKIEDGADLKTAMDAFKADPNVEHVEIIGVHPIDTNPNDSFWLGSQWNMKANFGINGSPAWKIENGDPSVIIGVLDTGVRYFHKDLGGNVAPWSPAAPQNVGNIFINPGEIPGNSIDDDGNGRVDDVIGYDFLASSTVAGCTCNDLDCNTIDNEPDDFNGHGTHVSGIAAAITNNSRGVAGTAGGFGSSGTSSVGDGARVMPLRIGWNTSNCGGLVSMAAAATAMNYVATMVDDGFNITAINCSWGSSNTGGIGAALTAVLARDVLVVKAAGNGNSSAADFLGANASVMAVGGTQVNGTGYASSNWGSWVDIAAPAVNITSTVRNSADPNPNNDYYASFDGTSMAAPHVCGVAALLESCAPQLTAAEKFLIMQQTSIPYNDPRDLGDGIVNANNAVREVCLLDVKFEQPLGGTGEDANSNVDLSDMTPSTVLADDFVSDGRPINAVYWWGGETPDFPTYRIDDGGAENSIGVNEGGTVGGTFGWANRFTNTTGGPVNITTIQVAFGFPGGATGVAIGNAVDAVIWIDAAATANMNNATPLIRWSLPGGVHANDGVTFANHTVPGGGVVIPPGADFYVGCGDIQSQNDAVVRFPAAIDQSPPLAVRSWAFFPPGTADPFSENLAGQTVGTIDSFGLPGNWLIRAGGDPAPTPDGWFISFHERLSSGGAPEEALGLYYCDESIVEVSNESRTTCDGNPVQKYQANLDDCCLVNAEVDSRSGNTPAQANEFLEEQCFTYALDIQAVIGLEYAESGGSCIGSSTGRSAVGDFWGWHTTNVAQGAAYGLQSAFESQIALTGGDYLYGPWATATPDCSSPNMAFALITETLVSGDTDVDNNGIPDACDAPPSIVADPLGVKNRFISFNVPAAAVASAGGTTAIRVNLTSLHHVLPPYTGGPSVPFTSFEGQARWVGAPTQYVESSSSGTPFFAANLQCDPHYRDWSTVSLLHVTGSAIVPSSLYDVENVSSNCLGIEDTCSAVSAAVQIGTRRWGDVETPFNPPSATVQPDVSDISALVDKFRSAPGAPIKARALLAGEPGNPFGEITSIVLSVDLGFSHISACVDAFRGVPYPYTISSCP